MEWAVQGRIASGIAATALLMSAPAQAQTLVDQPGRAPGFSVKVMSWAEIPFRTIVRQRFDFSCGSAAVATLLTYQYGLPTDETTPFKAMWDAGDQAKIKTLGFSLLDMKTYLTRRGLPAQGYRLDVSDIHSLARPMIALVTIKGYTHFVVIKGAEGKNILIGDPARGLLTLSDADFHAIWSGIALIIPDRDNGAKPQFNLARDWNPWTSSPTRSFQGERAINTITDNLPPIYQIEKQILPTIRVGGIQ
jgi:uncharacterized protein